MNVAKQKVNVAIVCRFHAFNESVISKCFKSEFGATMWKPMRPPDLLHSVGVLDMWNFIFSALESILNLQVPLRMCIGVFCNFSSNKIS